VENTWGVEKVGTADGAPRGGNAAEGLGGREEVTGTKVLFVEGRGCSGCMGTGSSRRRGARTVGLGARAVGFGARGASAVRAAGCAGAAFVTCTGSVFVTGASGIGWNGWLVGEIVNICMVFPALLT